MFSMRLNGYNNDSIENEPILKIVHYLNINTKIAYTPKKTTTRDICSSYKFS